MHLFDPNGSIHEARITRNRQDNYKSILFGIGFVCALIFGTTCFFIATDYLQH